MIAYSKDNLGSKVIGFAANPKESSMKNQNNELVNNFEEMSDKIYKFANDIVKVNFDGSMEDYQILQKSQKAVRIAFKELFDKNVFDHRLEDKKIVKIIKNIEKYAIEGKFNKEKTSLSYTDIDDITNVIDETNFIGLKYNEKFNRAVFLTNRSFYSVYQAKKAMQMVAKKKRGG